MSDRADEARAEAERHPQAQGLEDTIEDFMTGISTYGNLSDIDRQMGADLADFLAEQGVVWADANPKPPTITHDDIGAAYAVFMDAEGHPVRRFIVALKAIGIDVEDDDE